MGGLAGHLVAAVRRLQVALDEPVPEDPRVLGLAELYGVNRVDSAEDLADAFHQLVRDDGEGRGNRGPEAVRERFEAVVAQLRERLSQVSSGALVPVVRDPRGATPYEACLMTRVVELVVHSDDLAVSAGLAPLRIPSSAAAVAIEVSVELARARSGDVEVIRAFSRAERALPDALRVL